MGWGGHRNPLLALMMDRQPAARVIGREIDDSVVGPPRPTVSEARYAASLARMADDHEREDERTKRRRQHQRAATRHERAARTDREAADAAELFGEAGAAEDHREDARQHETAADN